MRFYSIVITSTAGVLYQPPGFQGLLGNASYTSFVNGQTLPAAWDVEIDIPTIDVATSQGAGTVRVWGISLAEIQQSANLNGYNIAVYGGMAPGLPLANPAQQGLLVQGQIQQCFGNWIGTDMTLDFVIVPGSATSSNPGGPGTLGKPKNLSLNWPGGQPLSGALQSCLQTAFPGYTVNCNISSNIVRPAGDSPFGFYSSLEQLAIAVRGMSKSIVKTQNYQGVSIVQSGMNINVFDGSSSQGQGQAVAINFTDLIGQPTWIQSPNISVKTVMRADLKIGQSFTLPQTQITNTAAAFSNISNQALTFAGGFNVLSLRHIGRYRAPTADAWVTVIEGYPQNPVSTQAA